MSIIKAPFNFVTLSDMVFFPEWADKISQDIPFSDGLSGTIKFTITAESPIFIRNGHKDESDKTMSEKEKSFSHIDTAKGPRYFIPATSIKGEVRNLLEIMSFGKMNVDSTAMFSRRDLNDKNVYPLLKNQKDVKCGWLRRKGNDFEIINCGRFWRISQPKIDEWLKCKIMRQNFSADAVKTLEDSKKTAAYKYEITHLKDEQFEDLTFQKIKTNTIGDSIVEVSGQGDLKGTIVMTGQPSPWTEPRDKRAKGKYYEFVFPDKEKGSYPLTKEQYLHYEFIYRNTANEDDWARIKKLLDESEQGGRGVPVFFRVKNNSIEDFGMAYLYKLPYGKSVEETLPCDHKNKDKHDLAECMFGYIGDKDALKGRVQFGNAFSDNAHETKEVRLVLGSPKASYYPIYVEQDGRNGVVANYNTYDQGHLRGWKRYITRKDTNSVKNTGNDKVDTLMVPLQTGATFSETITFHNLRPVELGALLSALTFHGTQECRHQLGMAKPYGFGKCQYSMPILDATKLRTGEKAEDTNFYMGLFEDAMDKSLGTGWINCQQLTELLAMAAANVANNERFDYMEMSNNHDDNEFLKAKKGKEYLERATQLISKNTQAITLITDEVKAEIEKVKREEEERIRKQKVAEYNKKYSKKIANAKNDKIILNYIKVGLANITDADLKQFIEEMTALIDNYIKKIDQDKTFATEFPGSVKKFCNYKIWESRMKAGLRITPLTALTDEDKSLAYEKLLEAYHTETEKNHRMSKNWSVHKGSYFKDCAKLVGNDLATEWFNRINEK